MSTVAIYDWDKAEQLYIEGVVGQDGKRRWPPAGEIADAIGVRSSHQISNRASQYGWPAKRKAFKAQIADFQRQAVLAALVEKRIEVDSSAIGLARTGLDTIDEWIRGGQIETAAQLDKMAEAALKFHELGVRACGDAPINRLEVSGPEGKPVEVDVRAQMVKDDPARLAAFLEAAERAGITARVPEPAALDVGEAESEG